MAARAEWDARPVNVTHPLIWDPCLPMIFDAIEAHGVYRKTKDQMNVPLTRHSCP